VKSAAANGPAQTVYIRPKPFVEAMQSPKGDGVLQAMPELVDKTREALANDSHIAIPVEGVATHIAPSDAWDGLADHLTLSPHDASLAEVHDDAVATGTEIQAQYAAAKAGAADGTAFDRSTQAVGDDLHERLNAANPFSAEDNAVRAGLLGQIYAIQASREGKTPEDLYRQVPLLEATPDRSVAAASNSPHPSPGADYSNGRAANPILASTNSEDSALQTNNDGEERVPTEDVPDGDSVSDVPMQTKAVAPEDAFSLDQSVIDHIRSLPKELRPDPTTYIPPHVIDAHLKQFDQGASRIMLLSNLNEYGPAQKDGTAFVMTNREANLMLEAAGGDARELEKALGLPEGFLNSDQLVRVDIPAPRDLGLRIPQRKGSRCK
jgi:hypothetical protein